MEKNKPDGNITLNGVTYINGKASKPQLSPGKMLLKGLIQIFIAITLMMFAYFIFHSIK